MYNYVHNNVRSCCSLETVPPIVMGYAIHSPCCAYFTFRPFSIISWDLIEDSAERARYEGGGMKLTGGTLTGRGFAIKRAYRGQEGSGSVLRCEITKPPRNDQYSGQQDTINLTETP